MSVSSEADASTPSYSITIDGNGVKVSKEIDADTATEILAMVMGGSSRPSTRTRAKKPARSRASKPSKTGGNGSKPPAKRKAGSPGIVKDLSMRPKGKKTFMEFIAEKQPSTHQQKQAVILYWLRNEAAMAAGITTDHVNTCYLEANWPRPATLDNAMQVTAKVKGWFDTSDMSNIRLMTRGEDEVKHNLPPPAKKK